MECVVITAQRSTECEKREEIKVRQIKRSAPVWWDEGWRLQQDF